MFPAIHKISSITWVAFNEDFTATEHSSLNDAMKNEPLLIVHEARGTWTNNNYSNPAYGAIMYDSKGDKVDSIRIGKWLLSNLSITGHYPRVVIKFSITDPWGKTESMVFGDYREGIRNALIFLSNASTWTNWTELKNNDPNKDLEKLLKDNSDKINSLENENGSLKTKASQLNGQVEELENEIIRLNNQIERAKSVLSGLSENAISETE